MISRKNSGSTDFVLLAGVPNAEGDEQPRYPCLRRWRASARDGESLVYFPYHLGRNAEIQLYPGQSVIPDNAAYPADAEIAAFKAFYQELAACETQREGNAISVTNTKSGRTMRLTFLEEQGQSMVRFSAES